MKVELMNQFVLFCYNLVQVTKFVVLQKKKKRTHHLFDSVMNNNNNYLSTASPFRWFAYQWNEVLEPKEIYFVVLYNKYRTHLTLLSSKIGMRCMYHKSPNIIFILFAAYQIVADTDTGNSYTYDVYITYRKISRISLGRDYQHDEHYILSIWHSRFIRLTLSSDCVSIAMGRPIIRMHRLSNHSCVICYGPFNDDQCGMLQLR